jgi:hypothetical protein
VKLLPEKIGWRDHLVGAGLALVYVIVLVVTARTVGVPRDEGFYFRAAHEYARWFEAFFKNMSQASQRGMVDGIWGYNHEHPPLMKSLFALSWMYLHQKWKLFADESTAIRFPAMVTAGIAVWTTYMFGARAFSRRAGVIAAFAFALMPHVFFHAHLACFDVPITAMWTLCIYVYWRSLKEGGLPWAIAAGVVYGLTLATKHNAWIVPFVVIPHAIFAYRRSLRRNVKAGLIPIPGSIVAMAILGPLVFYASWPWIWNDTFPRLQEYANFHLNHEYYNMEFLGKNYFGPPSPRGYMPLMIAGTVPAITLILFLVGAGDRLRVAFFRLRRWVLEKLKRPVPGEPIVVERGETDLLLALAIGASLGPWLLAKTPIFGGTKHWMTAYPFMAVVAGGGFDLTARAMDAALAKTARFAEEKARYAAMVLLGVIVVLPALVQTWRSHPFGLANYTTLVGSTPGAATLGLNRQFWGYTTQDANRLWMGAHAPQGATVFIHDTAWDAWARMTAEKRVRPDLRGVGAPHESQIALIQHELHMNEVDYNVWVALGTVSPAYVVTHHGVPIVSIYQRK